MSDTQPSVLFKSLDSDSLPDSNLNKVNRMMKRKIVSPSEGSKDALPNKARKQQMCLDLHMAVCTELKNFIDQVEFQNVERQLRNFWHAYKPGRFDVGHGYTAITEGEYDPIFDNYLVSCETMPNSPRSEHVWKEVLADYY